MKHEMRLEAKDIEKIRKGRKTVEIRLFDEKRQKIDPGDKIKFISRKNPEESVLTEVVDLLRYKTFTDLYEDLSPELTGNKTKEEQEKVYNYYNGRDEEKYGVVGIRIKICD